MVSLVSNVNASHEIKKPSSSKSYKENIMKEFVETEGLHVIKLMIIREIFAVPMYSKNYKQEELSRVFLNYDKLLEIHKEIYEMLFNKWTQPEPLAQILFDIFSGKCGKQLKFEASYYCVNYVKSLDTLKSFRDDPKMEYIFQPERKEEMPDFLSRNTIEDLLASIHQRITKYPLLIDRLLKSISSDSPEYLPVKRALENSRKILSEVNQTMDLHKRQEKFESISLKTKRKHGLTFDIKGKTLIHDGPLKWKLSNYTTVNVHMVLTEKVP